MLIKATLKALSYFFKISVFLKQGLVLKKYVSFVNEKFMLNYKFPEKVSNRQPPNTIQFHDMGQIPDDPDESENAECIVNPVQSTLLQQWWKES